MCVFQRLSWDAGLRPDIRMKRMTALILSCGGAAPRRACAPQDRARSAPCTEATFRQVLALSALAMLQVYLAFEKTPTPLRPL